MIRWHDADRRPGTASAPLRLSAARTRARPAFAAPATLLGAGAIGAAIGLLATSAWLISRRRSIRNSPRSGSRSSRCSSSGSPEACSATASASSGTTRRSGCSPTYACGSSSARTARADRAPGIPPGRPARPCSCTTSTRMQDLLLRVMSAVRHRGRSSGSEPLHCVWLDPARRRRRAAASPSWWPQRSCRGSHAGVHDEGSHARAGSAAS